ncbi:ABC transporter ATP-binding protein [Arthrobacter sp. H14]|uniref:ABC transporter ATP-binding protein n=1 Tax=Arthrobacter sp. H14 TaxID=1312959 RepID=UPI00047C75F3|nr:ABC transporter ATP-binding protein [Arthrobacter sp. H14]
MLRSDSPCLQIDGLIKDFGPVPALEGKMVRVLDGINLKAFRGQVTALLGANGAGKTTTIECAQGLLKRDGGTIRLLDGDPGRPTPSLRARVGVMLQDGGLPPSARPIPLLRHVAGMYRNPRSVDGLVERLGIDSFAGTSIRRLSGGQKQRLAMAASLVGNPEVLFLDEPSAGLDPQSRVIVFDLVRELRDEGLGIVLTTHLLDDAQRLADYVYIIDAGRTVTEGTVPELINSKRSAGTGRVLTFEATPGLDLETMVPSGLSAIETRPGSYTVTGPVTAADLAALATAWDAAGVMPTALQLSPRSLEDVFLEVSGKERR